MTSLTLAYQLNRKTAPELVKEYGKFQLQIFYESFDDSVSLEIKSKVELAIEIAKRRSEQKVSNLPALHTPSISNTSVVLTQKEVPPISQPNGHMKDNTQDSSTAEDDVPDLLAYYYQSKSLKYLKEHAWADV